MRMYPLNKEIDTNTHLYKGEGSGFTSTALVLFQKYRSLLLLQKKANQCHRHDTGDDREGKTFAGQCDKDCRYRCCEVERRQCRIIIALSKQQVLKKQSAEQADWDER